MRLGGMVLSNFCDHNDFQYGTLKINEGNAGKLCVQLVDLNKKVCSSISGTFYLRYIPAAGASLKIKVQSIDDSQTVEKIATQDLNDPSVWCIDILEGEVLATSNIHLELSESGPTTQTGVIVGGVQVEKVGPNNGHSFC
jgi:hypothetical protein